MKKSHVLLAMAGLLTLTGCNKPVMGDRTYVPAKDEKAIGASRQQYKDFGSDDSYGNVPAASNLPESQPAAAPAVQEAPARSGRTSGYAPMESIQTPAGITAADPARKGGKKAVRKRQAKKIVSAKGGVYVVKAGDYPQKIARMHGISVLSLLEANKMTMADAKKLQIGQKLVIPARGAKKADKAKNNGKTSAVKAEAGIYVVRPGDFPQRIARRLKVKLADLLKANNLTMESSRNLKIGQKLVIPGAKIAAAAKTTGEKAESTGTPKETAKPIAENNPLKDADNVAEKVEEGSPEATDNEKKPETSADDNTTEPYELPEDTTFKKLAEKFNTTEEHMRRLNFDITSDADLIKGKCILVPTRK